MTPAFRNALVLTGPTASGKSELALDLAGRLGAEIVCMDSMTLYRGMDVGTAKPSAADQARVPHHLLDMLDPWESASVAWWLERAAEAVRTIEARGRVALFVGGTPLYLKAMVSGLFQGPPADPDLRARLERQSPEELFNRLSEVDPAAAGRIHENDLRRVIRALEVFELTGRPISDWQRQWAEPPSVAAQPRVWWLDWPREVLHGRINVRVHRMIAAGWIDETRDLLALPRPLSQEAVQAVGYAELFEYLQGRVDLTATVGRIQTRTRQFAKRQVTWFRHLGGCRRMLLAGASDLAPAAAIIFQEVQTVR